MVDPAAIHRGQDEEDILAVGIPWVQEDNLPEGTGAKQMRFRFEAHWIHGDCFVELNRGQMADRGLVDVKV